MIRASSITPLVVLKWCLCVLIIRVTASVIALYPQYVPPDFDADFLLDREGYFWGSYSWSFYAHLISGPSTLIIGLILLNNRVRGRWPKPHRNLGRLQIALVIFLLTPSGLWMSRYAMTGPIAGVGFAMLSLATGTAAILGWRAAVRKEFRIHREWMLRLYSLLCSAVVIRVIGGVASASGTREDWIYMTAAWLSWLIPLAAVEGLVRTRIRKESVCFGSR